MRRYNPEYNPVVVPSNLHVDTFKIVLFRVGEVPMLIPPFLLLATPSIFLNFKDDLGGSGMKAAIESVKFTATSTKAFDVVFQPLLYGYLDMEEINRQNTSQHHPFALLVDGLILADKIKADSVVTMIQQELQDTYGHTGISINAISKLFQGLPMTYDFLLRYLSRAALSGKGVKILEQARRTITGFVKFERVHALYNVGGPLIKSEPGRTIKHDAKEDKDAAGTPFAKNAKLTRFAPSSVEQGKRPVRDISPVIPEDKRLKKENFPTETPIAAAAVPPSPAHAQQLSTIVRPSTNILKDLDNVTSNVSVQITAPKTKASAHQAKEDNAKATMLSRNVVQTRQHRASSLPPHHKGKKASQPLSAGKPTAELAADVSNNTQPSALKPVLSQDAPNSGLAVVPTIEEVQAAGSAPKATKARRATKANKVTKPAAPAKAATQTFADPKPASKPLAATQITRPASGYGSIHTAPESRPYERRRSGIIPEKVRGISGLAAKQAAAREILRRVDAGENVHDIDAHEALAAATAAAAAEVEAAPTVAASNVMDSHLGDGDTVDAAHSDGHVAQPAGVNAAGTDGAGKVANKAKSGKGKAARAGKGASAGVDTGAGAGVATSAGAGNGAGTSTTTAASRRPRRATKKLLMYCV